jgi:hypothetical protein
MSSAKKLTLLANQASAGSNAKQLYFSPLPGFLVIGKDSLKRIIWERSKGEQMSSRKCFEILPFFNQSLQFKAVEF